MLNQATNNLIQFDTVLKNPTSLVALIALFVNVLISAINIYLIITKNTCEGEYKTEIEFYKLTVLHSLEQLFIFITDIKTQFSEVIVSYNQLNESSKCRKLSEQSIAKLDSLKDKNEASIFPYYDGFSAELASELRKIIEQYYDTVTTILSKYSQPGLSPSSLLQLQNNFSFATKEAISKIYILSKKYCPKQKILKTA